MRGCIFDLDGTLYRGEKIIPGAPSTVAELRRRGCGVVFVSNKPLERREAYAEKLTGLGIPASPEDVINSSLVLARYLVREMPEATVFAIGEPPLLDELAAAGIRLSETPQEIDDAADAAEARSVLERLHTVATDHMSLCDIAEIRRINGYSLMFSVLARFLIQGLATTTYLSPNEFATAMGASLCQEIRRNKQAQTEKA